MRRGMEQREANFLKLVERGVQGNPRSPYARLLRLARCEMGDLREMVRTRGLVSALRSLRDAGVYVTFEEYKGREPIVRHGESFKIAPADFDNPFISASYQSETGGEHGRRARASGTTSIIWRCSRRTSCCSITRTALLDAPVCGTGAACCPTAAASIISCARRVTGGCAEKWFSPTQPGVAAACFPLSNGDLWHGDRGQAGGAARYRGRRWSRSTRPSWWRAGWRRR